MQQIEVFGLGCDILDSLLQPHGFRRADEYEHQYPSIVDNGEIVIRGEFNRPDRRLELELGSALQRVVYRIDQLWLEHAPYMRALSVPVGKNAYPGFSSDPLDGFRHLAADLKNYTQEFFTGDAAVLRRAASEEASRRPERDRRRQAWMVGDDSARRRARELFRERRYREVVVLLEAIQHPEFIDDFELTILEVSRRRSWTDSGSGTAIP